MTKLSAFALAGLAIVAISSTAGTIASAAPPQHSALLRAERRAAAAELPAHARANSGTRGVVDAAALDRTTLSLALPDGRTITAERQRSTRDDRRGVRTWLGRFTDETGGSLVVTQARGVITGYANHGGVTLELLPASSGRHVLFAVDPARVPSLDLVDQSFSGGDLATGVEGASAEPLAVTGTAVVHDLLVLYTAASANAYGQAGLAGMIESAVQSANQAYINSQVGVDLNIVGVQASPVSESGSGMSSTLNSLKNNSTVRGLRDSLAADMVMLISQETDWCGYANLTMTSTTINGVTTSNTDAYAITAARCLSNNTLAHEIGHLQGLDHDRANSTGSGFYAYSYGYRRCVDGGFTDIMSYPCSVSVPRILNFSNPAISYNGYPTGVSYESSPTQAAEAARSLVRSATQVANYRVAGGSSATQPTAPSGLRTTSVGSSSVGIAWTDNAGNESGFKLERSLDGVVWQEIASLGSNAVSFTDNAVSAATNYYYRVRAFNSSGYSAYAAPISVRTSDPPPAVPVAPITVAAQNRADGTALVSWTVGTTTATSYDVRRETWNSRKGTWGSSTIIASVPAGTLSLVNSSGAGTFRYFVRATNSGGSSLYTGPATVTVTGGTSSKGRTR